MVRCDEQLETFECEQQDEDEPMLESSLSIVWCGEEIETIGCDEEQDDDDEAMREKSFSTSSRI